uniref:Reverse transcriptase domain-containing protein n=1 Tax=Oryzias latipes TaxID=8090 RepID=A0A3B3IJR3_ORYLA
MSNFNFVSLNVRGLRDNVKRKSMFLFCKNVKASCILLQETHSVKADEQFWSNQWGDKILFCHGTNKSSGVALLFKNCSFKVITHISDDDGHWLICVLKTDDGFLILCNVYGYNIPSHNKLLLTEIAKHVKLLNHKYCTNTVVIGGDYNMVLDEWLDRVPSKFNTHHINPTLRDFCLDVNVSDPWRIKNPLRQTFSWFKPNGSSKSRIDFWLVSNNLLQNKIDVNISAAPLTDHCLIELNVSSQIQKSFGRGYWKFNSSLLTNETFCNAVIELLETLNSDSTLKSYTDKWEFFKFKVRQTAIKHSKLIAKHYKQKETEILTELNQICSKPVFNEDDKQRRSILQCSLDDIYIKKAKGAFIRSRAKWVELGEKSTSYFCNLEKKRQEKNTIKKLHINNQLCSDPQMISKEISSFYSNLYSSSYSESHNNTFFQTIKDFIPKIDDNFRNSCDSEITLQELEKALSCLSNDKAPGCDGLTSNFYKFFWQHIKDLIFEMFKEIIQNGSLTHTMKQGVITLIPKPGKDPTFLDNLRPITLLNTDYKLLTHIFSNRFKSDITQIISETQSGFIKGRSIHNNLRLVLDMIDYEHLIDTDGFILFLDFYKAFDMIEHNFMFQTLQFFGFGNKFINTVKTFYYETSSCVCLPQGTSHRFNINKGIKQGCPISPLLFIAAAEMLSLLIKHTDFGKLTVANAEFSISQLADDTTIFLNNLHDIPKILKTIDIFSKASGLKLNLNKCEILPIKPCTLLNAYNIPIKSTVKYLGMHITKNKTDLEKLNVWDKLEKCSTLLNNWAQRDLSIFGRILLTKIESISRFIYPTYSIGVPKQAIKSINQVNFNFIWKRKTHYVKQGTLTKKYEDGGLQAIDFNSLNGTLKINWLKSFIRNQNSIWFIVPNKIFSSLGGIQFLLSCDFDNKKLPIQLSSFHQQVLMYWKLIYKHNYSPHNTPLWNCRYITIRNKSVFVPTWFENGIWSLMHLLNDNATLMSFDDFTAKYGSLTNRKDFEKIIKAIPQNVVSSVSDLFHNDIYRHPTVPKLLINGHNIATAKLPNLQIREYFNVTSFPYVSNPNYITQYFNNSKKKQIRTKYLKLPIPPKAKEVHFKTFSGIYPSKELLRKRFGIPENCCSFCHVEIETTEHLFFECFYSDVFWNSLHYWLFPKIPLLADFSIKDIIFGFILENKNTELILNVVIILGKFYIHKCRFLKIKPFFSTFHKELCSFFSSVNFMENKLAMELQSIICKLQLLDSPLS